MRIVFSFCFCILYICFYIFLTEGCILSTLFLNRQQLLSCCSPSAGAAVIPHLIFTSLRKVVIMSHSLNDFLKMLYLDSNIPSYLYRFPEQRFTHTEPETVRTYISARKISPAPDRPFRAYRAHLLSVHGVRKLLRMCVRRRRSGHTAYIRPGFPYSLL